MLGGCPDQVTQGYKVGLVTRCSAFALLAAKSWLHVSNRSSRRDPKSLFYDVLLRRPPLPPVAPLESDLVFCCPSDLRKR